MSQTARGWNEWEDSDEPETRTCEEGCSHYDTLNQCCWIVSGRGLFTEVTIGDLCRYGFKEGSHE